MEVVPDPLETDPMPAEETKPPLYPQPSAAIVKPAEPPKKTKAEVEANACRVLRIAAQNVANELPGVENTQQLVILRARLLEALLMFEQQGPSSAVFRGNHEPA